MEGIAEKLNIWINSSLNPALSAYHTFMSAHRKDMDSVSDHDGERAMEEFNKTYELLVHAMTELRKVFEVSTIEKDSSQFIDLTLNKFKEKCKTYKLTERETEIIKLIALGQSSKSIADALFISYKTVQSHISKIYKKVEVSNRITLITKLDLPYINT